MRNRSSNVVCRGGEMTYILADRVAMPAAATRVRPLPQPVSGIASTGKNSSQACKTWPYTIDLDTGGPVVRVHEVATPLKSNAELCLPIFGVF